MVKCAVDKNQPAIGTVQDAEGVKCEYPRVRRSVPGPTQPGVGSAMGDKKPPHQSMQRLGDGSEVGSRIVIPCNLPDE